MQSEIVAVDLKTWKDHLMRMKFTAKETTAIASLLSASIVLPCRARNRILQSEHS
jgi:hypothetical protein